MKKKYIYLIITLCVILVIISIIRWRNRIYRKYSLRSDNNGFIQIYRLREEDGHISAYPYLYCTGVTHVKAAAGKKASIFSIIGGADGTWDFIPVSKVFIENGKKIKCNPKKDYILLDDIDLQ